MFQCGDHATKPVSTKMASTIPTTLCPLLRLTLSQRASRGETVWMIVPGIIELEGKPEIGGCNDVDSQYIYVYICMHIAGHMYKYIYIYMIIYVYCVLTITNGRRTWELSPSK